MSCDGRSDSGVEFVSAKAREIINEVSKAIVGQYEVIEQMVVVLFSGGHILLEGVPGLAKTLTAKMIARAVKADFKRVQFTPDLMPSDITGTKVYDIKNASFYIRKGPIFTNIFLADEINRTPPKTQAALLESMEEKTVTIDGEPLRLSEPFMVVATQNPLEYEGTYPLPEAQLDRFMIKLTVDYIPQKFENILLEKFNRGFDSSDDTSMDIKQVCDYTDIQRCRAEIMKVEVNNSIINYITSVVRATRNTAGLLLGASPRACIALLLASKCFAAVQGRNFVTPEDIRDLALPVLRHRVILRPEAGLDGLKTDDLIKSILNKVEVPR